MLGDTSDKLGSPINLGVMTGISSRSSCILENPLDGVFSEEVELLIVTDASVITRAVADGVGGTTENVLH